jgi:putative transposase
MIRFKSARQCQRFVSIHGPIANLFHLHRNRTSTAEHRKLRNAAMNTWHEITLSTAA